VLSGPRLRTLLQYLYLGLARYVLRNSKFVCTIFGGVGVIGSRHKERMGGSKGREEGHSGLLQVVRRCLGSMSREEEGLLGPKCMAYSSEFDVQHELVFNRITRVDRD
jgi:hypothetical protein